MARYSRRQGPAAPFELIAGFNPIPGMEIIRHFDGGELLILSRVTIQNATAGAGDFFTRFFIDGTNPQPQVPGLTIPAAGFGALSDVFLHSIDEGRHTIRLDALGLAAAGDVVIAGGASLVVIQLPLWDSPADLL